MRRKYKEIHIKSPDKRFCTRVLGYIKNGQIYVKEILDVSLDCNEKDEKK